VEREGRVYKGFLLYLEVGIYMRSIKVDNETWERLHKLRIFLSRENKAKSLKDVIKYLLDYYAKTRGVESGQ